MKININKIAVVALSTLLLSGIAVSQKTFSIVSVPGSSPNTSIAINNGGEVVVNTGTVNSYLVSEWNRVSGIESVGLVGTNSGGAAIDSSNDVVGAGDADNAGYFQAFFWQSTAGTQWLGSLGGNLSGANALSDSGAVVGFSYTGASMKHAFLWTAAGGMQDLTTDLTSIGGATAMAVNVSNQVAGYYYPNGSVNTLGFVWTEAAGLQNVGSTGSVAYGINNSGTVVGQATLANGARHAFSWTQSGGMVDLGTLGGSASTALGVNSQGWVVGTSLTATKQGILHGFLWTPTGGMQDFTVVAGMGQNEQAYSVRVNDFGVIAVSTNKGSFVLVPKMTAKLTSSLNPSVVGQPVTFKATFTSIAGTPPDGETVQFMVGTTVLGTATLTGGVAQFTTSALTEGANPVVANYIGDTNYLPTKSATLTQVVN